VGPAPTGAGPTSCPSRRQPPGILRDYQARSAVPPAPAAPRDPARRGQVGSIASTSARDRTTVMPSPGRPCRARPGGSAPRGRPAPPLLRRTPGCHSRTRQPRRSPQGLQCPVENPRGRLGRADLTGQDQGIGERSHPEPVQQATALPVAVADDRDLDPAGPQPGQETIVVGGAGTRTRSQPPPLACRSAAAPASSCTARFRLSCISSPVIPLTAGSSGPDTVGTVSHRRDLRGDTQRDARASDECQQQDPRHIHRRGKARSKQCEAEAGYYQGRGQQEADWR
jgi:hypothetical protein